MNKDQKTTLLSAGILALAILAGSAIIAERVSRSLDEKNLWAGSNIPQVASDVHNVTSGVSQAVTGLTQIVDAWTRA